MTVLKSNQQVLGISFFIAVVVLLGILLHVTLSWMLDPQRLPLSKVVIQGNLQYVSPQDVQQALSKLGTIGTFMSQDVRTLQQSVQAIPWVEHASIRKQWPDTIKVFLTERQVEGVWNDRALLDENGQIFDGNPSILKTEHVKFYGPKETAPLLLKAWQDYNPNLKELGLSISSLILNERRAWQMILSNGIRLKLGKESIQERLSHFILLYQYLGKDVDRIKYIDLRYDTGAAIGWKIPPEQLEQENQENTDGKNER